MQDRDKDIEYFKAAVDLGLLSKETLIERCEKTPIPDERRGIIREYIKRGFSR